MTENMAQSAVLEKFLSMYQSKSTVNTYKYAIKEYFQSLGVSDIDHYFTDHRDYEEDVRTFFTSIINRPPLTINVMLAGTRTFLLENNVELNQLFWKRLRGKVRGSKAQLMDEVPTNSTLKKILIHMSIHGKALFLVLVSSGMRIGECLRLKLSDINETKINIRGEYTKTGNPRVSYISDEAKEYLNEWLKVRQKYLVEASARSVVRPQYIKPFKGKSIEDDRIFPFDANTAHAIWNNALKKSLNGEMQQVGMIKRYLIHPHVLRKFFRSRMATLIPVDIVEALMGHEGYLTDVYRRYSQEDLLNYYKKGEESVLIFSNISEAVAKIKKDVELQNINLQDSVHVVLEENKRLNGQITSLENQVSKMENLMMETLDGIKDLVCSIRTNDEELKRVAADKLEKSHIHASNYLDK